MSGPSGSSPARGNSGAAVLGSRRCSGSQSQIKRRSPIDHCAGRRSHMSSITPPAEENQRPWLDEHDSCALIANVRKAGRPTHGNVKRTLAALGRMGHRTGEVAGEGDGCGLLTDIPRIIWARTMESIGQRGELASDPQFFVIHLFLPRSNTDEIVQQITEIAELSVLQILYSAAGQTRPEMLGPLARAQEPIFWQIAGYAPGRDVRDANARLFEFQMQI